MSYIELWTDGGCIPNPGIGGWGYKLIYPDDKVITDCGGEMDTTNNRMEIQAVIEGLKKLHGGNVLIFSDSQYVVNAINSWINGWKKKRWMRKANKPVLNKDLWIELDNLLKGFTYHAKWVKGHNGNIHNEDCDELASKGRVKVEDEEIERKFKA